MKSAKHKKIILKALESYKSWFGRSEEPANALDRKKVLEIDKTIEAVVQNRVEPEDNKFSRRGSRSSR